MKLSIILTLALVSILTASCGDSYVEDLDGLAQVDLTILNAHHGLAISEIHTELNSDTPIIKDLLFGEDQAAILDLDVNQGGSSVSLYVDGEEYRADFSALKNLEKAFMIIYPTYRGGGNSILAPQKPSEDCVVRFFHALPASGDMYITHGLSNMITVQYGTANYLRYEKSATTGCSSLVTYSLEGIEPRVILTNDTVQNVQTFVLYGGDSTGGIYVYSYDQ